MGRLCQAYGSVSIRTLGRIMVRPKQVGPYPGEYHIEGRKRSQWYKWTGEQPRPILAGEYYLSGSIPQAYRAYADPAGPYFPAVPIVLEACAGCEGKGKVESRA